MSAAADHAGLRTEAERVVAEDNGDAELSDPPSRGAWLGHLATMLFVVAVRRLADRRRIAVPPALRLDGAEAIQELFNAAYDSELGMLDELVERAGLGWRCQAGVGGFPCRWMNVGTAVCGGCGASYEAQGKEEPDE